MHSPDRNIHYLAVFCLHIPNLPVKPNSPTLPPAGTAVAAAAQAVSPARRPSFWWEQYPSAKAAVSDRVAKRGTRCQQVSEPPRTRTHIACRACRGGCGCAGGLAHGLDNRPVEDMPKPTPRVCGHHICLAQSYHSPCDCCSGQRVKLSKQFRHPPLRTILAHRSPVALPSLGLPHRVCCGHIPAVHRLSSCRLVCVSFHPNQHVLTPDKKRDCLPRIRMCRVVGTVEPAMEEIEVVVAVVC